MLYLYNTLTHKKEIFRSIKKSIVGMYSCGPTVYWYQHIGNLRTYIFSDLLKRVLLYNKYKINQIINLTDVGHLTSDADDGEDKIEKAAEKERKSVQDIAEYYFNIFHQDLKKLNIIEPSRWVKATEHIKEQINLIQQLERKNYTYKTSDGIYFDSSKFRGYGKLANIKVKKLMAGRRISMKEKKHPTDFALWKFSGKPGARQQEWDSPWGVGFPGWHIECSAMAMKYLGKHFDIHTGGQDNIPVHHTNEIAQSESATGRKFVNYWMHGAFLIYQGKKVSKSTGGLYTLSELIKMGYNPMHYRYLCLLTHYKKPLNFTLDNLDSAKNAFERLKRKIIELRKKMHKGLDKTKEYEKKFHSSINDDLNIPKALQVLLKALNDFNFDSKKKMALLEHFDSVLELGIKEMKETPASIPAEVEHLLAERKKLREGKKWEEADILRQRILERGYRVEDTPKGTKLEKA